MFVGIRTDQSQDGFITLITVQTSRWVTGCDLFIREFYFESLTGWYWLLLTWRVWSENELTRLQQILWFPLDCFCESEPFLFHKYWLWIWIWFWIWFWFCGSTGVSGCWGSAQQQFSVLCDSALRDLFKIPPPVSSAPRHRATWRWIYKHNEFDTLHRFSCVLYIP